MKQLTGNQMRDLWFEYWKTKDHEIIDSAPLVPIEDKSLLWMNAGVTPLKKYFDGSVIPKNKRMAGSQKCIRTNDIENVGKTARHHTFFEMLGNFSIGDYFKEEAIAWSWEFLTDEKWLNMPEEKLYVTVYPEDKEAKEIWKKIGLSDEHIIELEDNYWEIGEGPSGPDSEIFFDRGEQYDPKNLGIKLLKEDIENDRYIEMWNNVFTQYNSVEGLKREDYPELPNKNIDTGMGLERMLTILQDVETNYDTDIFAPIMYKISELSGVNYEGQSSFKIIADHARTIIFALADGANFGNNGRNYVLRRLIRRAIRHGKKIGINELFMDQLVEPVVNVMGDHYKEIKLEQDSIKRKIEREEILFNKTLDSGLKRLDELFKTSTNKEIEPKEVFKLYDTYGLPFDLTEEYSLENGFDVSKEKAAEYLELQRNLARQNIKKAEQMSKQNAELLEFKIESVFTGYEEEETISKIIGLFDGEKFTSEAKETIYIALNKTPFYEEAGGQVSDHGIIKINNHEYEIINAFTGPNHQVFHQVDLVEPISLNQEVHIKINSELRSKIKKNHSAAHLLQYALRKVLGKDIYQAGSRIDDETLRFDFTYDFKIDEEQLIEIEKIVNEEINQASPVTTKVVSKEEAEKLGAIALFDEKYGDKVRVLNIGDSIELCGGTHVSNTKEIVRFALASLENKGSSTYRIIGSTDENVEEVLYEAIKPYNNVMLETLKKARTIIEEASTIGIKLDFDFEIENTVPKEYKDVLDNRTEMEHTKQALVKLTKDYNDALEIKALENIDLYLELTKEIKGIKVLILKLFNQNNKTLKTIIDELINRLGTGFVFIANVSGNNVNYISAATKGVENKVNVGDLVREASIKSEGNGGGSNLFAQGGGTTTTYVDQILGKILIDLGK